MPRRKHPIRSALALAAALSLAAAPAAFAGRTFTGTGLAPSPVGQGSLTEADIAAKVGYDQHLGAGLPLDLRFTDENGRSVALGQVASGRAAIYALVYFDCPMLCSLVETGVLGAIKGMNLVPGRDFDVVFVSFDPKDTPEKALAKKTDLLARYGHTETAGGWHFLTGSEDAIARLTSAAGFRYAYDATTKQFAHPSGIFVATADGRIARYLFGVEYAPRDVRLALVEAGRGKIGGLVDKLLILCYRYDPTLGKYTPATMLALRIGGALTLLALGAFWLVMARRGRGTMSAAAGGIR